MHRGVFARRVVSGLDDDGMSAIVSDNHTASHVETDAFTINQIWQVDEMPPHVLADDTSSDQVSIAPPKAGFVYLVTTFPPDASWDFSSGYKDALTASGGTGAHVDDNNIPGLHETDTVDITTVISGEIYAVLESGETCLRAGDSFVQRGTKHTWSNRTDKPCSIVAVMMGAVR
jgi:mannose-6-phosphate isomerase-like protein (cupin superfamily)